MAESVAIGFGGGAGMGLTGSASWITVVLSLSRIALITNSSLLGLAPTEGAISSDVRGFFTAAECMD